MQVARGNTVNYIHNCIYILLIKPYRINFIFIFLLVMVIFKKLLEV